MRALSSLPSLKRLKYNLSFGIIIELEPGLDGLLLTEDAEELDLIGLYFHEINTFQDLLFMPPYPIRNTFLFLHK